MQMQFTGMLQTARLMDFALRIPRIRLAPSGIHNVSTCSFELYMAYYLMIVFIKRRILKTANIRGDNAFAIRASSEIAAHYFVRLEAVP